MSKIRERNFEYDPVVFLRCHTKTDTDLADVQTQVWQASFENRKKSKVVATCGGNKLCIINAKTTEIEQRYTLNIKDNLYALSWGSINNEMLQDAISVLATGGLLKIIYFVCPKQKAVLTQFTVPTSNSKAHISNLLFHPKQENVLFCSTSAGEVFILRIDLNPDALLQVNILGILNANSEIFTITYCKYSHLLLAATEFGLIGWIVESDFDVNNTETVRFRLPKNSSNPESEGFDLVDSVEVIKHGLIAVKCALHGFIYVCNLHNAEREDQSVFTLNADYKLNWSETDNYYMGISVNYDKGLLTCGDDQGCIWLYDINQVKDDDSSPDTKTMKPVQKLVWPIVEDRYVAKSRKLDLDTYDIVIAKAAIHRKGKYIVAVTNNNTVCIWKLVSKSS